MSKAKRPPKKGVKRDSLAFVVATWLSGVLSLGLVWLSASVFMSDLASFRSCNANSSGLSVISCGKQAPNFGDLMLFILFALAAALSVSLFTAAWRLSRRTTK